MRALAKKRWRELWGLRGPAAAIALVLTCGVATFVGSPSSGSEARKPETGSSNRGTSSTARAATRVSTADTPGIASIRRAIRSGARVSEAKTSAKPYSP
jgi:hypothetical protein